MPYSPTVPERRTLATTGTGARALPNRRDNPTIAEPFNTENANARSWSQP